MVLLAFKGNHDNGGRCHKDAFMFDVKHFPKLECIGNRGNCYSCTTALIAKLDSLVKGDGNCPKWEE